jgi:hypothetical protein
MAHSNAGNPANLKEEKLPRRDWILLPLICLLTLFFAAVSAESIANRVFNSSETSLNSCLVLNDASTGVRGIPNSVCWEKIPEGQWTEYRFDKCGYREGIECGPKPPGTYRIVMVGSSFALGENVPVEKAFATLLPAELSRQTGRRVELYNEGMGYGFARNTALRFNDVLAAQPDMVLWALTPMDIGQGTATRAEIAAKKANRASWILSRVKDAYATNSIFAVMRAHVADTVIGVLLQHCFFERESQAQYVRSYLTGPERDSGFLKAETSPVWKLLLANFEIQAADIEGRTRSAGVPFVAVLVPNRAQAAMISLGEDPVGYDPYKLDDELRSIIERHGGAYIDILPDFRSLHNPEQGYYPVDGHLNANGHATISRLLAKALAGGAIPALKAAPLPQDAANQGK